MTEVDFSDNLLLKAKEVVSILPTATAKDTELKMLINAGILDLERQGIIVINSDNELTDNDLIISAIMMFVKANFGLVNINDKKLASETYGLLCRNIGLSNEYTVNGVVDNA